MLTKLRGTGPATRRFKSLWFFVSFFFLLLILSAYGCGGAKMAKDLDETYYSTPGIAPKQFFPKNEAYVLQHGDLIDIKFLYHPESDLEIQIRPDGKISLQTTGDIQAAGLTPAQLAETIETKSSETLRDPVVTVIVVRIAEQKVYVGGEVRRPGYVILSEGMTALQAILQCGGFQKTAQLDSILHIVTGKSDKYMAERLNLEAVVKENRTEMDSVLSPNDIVYVPSTFIAKANLFVEQYIRGLLPIRPGVTAYRPDN